METFYIWTMGCQMNQADSQRLGSALEQLGLHSVARANDADLVVFNSCVVRQSAEDKVANNLNLVRPVKQQRPGQVVALMGCMVGPRTDELQRRFPHVDLFMRPQQYGPLLDLVGEQMGVDWEGCVGALAPKHPDVTCYVPIIHGCDLMCSFCIIPYRRGRQISRPVDEIVREVELLAQRGVREVTVLGQTVDAYGHDLPDKPDLAHLLTALNQIPHLLRIRFLTSHPTFMSQPIVQSVADLPKVCEHINLPVQAGDDEVLRRMRRPYTSAEYRELVGRIRATVPGVSVSTDLIVGFPGETEDQFQRSMEMVADLRFGKVHCAAYSTRPGTVAHRTMDDNVPQADKVRRLKTVDQLQESILSDINGSLVGQTLEVLVDGHQKGKWRGRTRTDKLVFFNDGGERLGQLVDVKIDQASPWALQGTPVAVPSGA
ncbi:MAG TPA: tRNA (N6-isopentenyl adenosine(37)-C2)-methylthiotransferase MiaB [Dehalococcoidia bacterium]|nr:tRNA (N6-isopentenyl adenosine(37)-C2)-methylthiotransferase MiaB [Dehalococcoidia bacterium]